MEYIFYMFILTMVKSGKSRALYAACIQFSVCSMQYNPAGGRQKKRWEDNIKKLTYMGFADSEDREMWKGIVATSCVVPR